MGMRRLDAPSRAKKGRTWCGPYALATVSQLSYESALDVFKRVTGRERISGVWNSEMDKALHILGALQRFSVTCHDYDTHSVFVVENGVMRMKPLTLNQWYKRRKDKGGLYLLNVSRHYVVVNGNKIIDNQKPEWTTFYKRKGKGSYKRAHVHRVWKIE